MKPVQVLGEITAEEFRRDVIPLYQPAVLKGAFLSWPIVQYGLKGVESFKNYLLGFDNCSLAGLTIVDPESNGHILYKDNFLEFNFKRQTMPFREALNNICNSALHGGACNYMGAVPVQKNLPGMEIENENKFLDKRITPKIWIGNQSCIQPHFDTSDNIAVVAVGRRRFTLFPPEEIVHLYPGQLDITPAGQPMSVVSLIKPDLNRYPLYKKALDAAFVAELEPGDAIYIPPLWWHGVQALDSFNTLVNYWWNHSLAGNDSPYEALIHSVLTISSLPQAERSAWQSFFNYYAFQVEQHPLSYLPDGTKGVLEPMTPEIYKIIKSFLYMQMGVRKDK